MQAAASAAARVAHSSTCGHALTTLRPRSLTVLATCASGVPRVAAATTRPVSGSHASVYASAAGQAAPRGADTSSDAAAGATSAAAAAAAVATPTAQRCGYGWFGHGSGGGVCGGSPSGAASWHGVAAAAAAAAAIGALWCTTTGNDSGLGVGYCTAVAPAVARCEGAGGGEGVGELGAAAPVLSVADAIEDAMPSCVRIRPSQQLADAFPGTDLRQRSASSITATGSGFVISEDGYVVTNHHVAEACGGANGRLSVTFLDGRTFEASVVGGDEWCDVAVLKLQDSDNGKLRAAGFKPIKLGSSSDLRLGDTVVALGHPLGLKFAATSGIVSSNTKLPGDDLLFQRRRLPPELERFSYYSQHNAATMLQTDAKLVPGNSGGPLINTRGEVVAIATLVLQAGGMFGLNMAMPIDAALPVIRQIVKNGFAARNYLGMTVVALTPRVVLSQRRMDAKFTGKAQEGLLVTSVTPGSPAAKAGLRAGDIMLRLDGRPTGSFGQMFEALSVYEEGRVISADVRRGRQVLRMRVKPTALPKPQRKLKVPGPPGPGPARVW